MCGPSNKKSNSYISQVKKWLYGEASNKEKKCAFSFRNGLSPFSGLFLTRTDVSSRIADNEDMFVQIGRASELRK